jgi:serine/threonine protein kinase
MHTDPAPPAAVTASQSEGSGSWRRWAESDAPATRLGVGDILRERFVLEEAIGEGGMGLVFRARDRRREEARDRNPHVAIKVLGEEFKRHPDSLIALQREARRMQQLSHPNIAAVYDFDRDGSHVYLVMELLEGESLDKALARGAGKGLPFEQARQVIESAGAALRHAHSRGLVHSDFKPANVFLTRDGEVKVIDFGIARFAKDATPGKDKESTMTVFDAGELGAWTNAYASPEQMLATAPPDPRDDIYAFGLVVYEALAGRHPFARKSAVEARFREMKFEPVPGLTEPQNAALAASLAFDREKRSGDVMELVQAFAPGELRIVATRDTPRPTDAPPATPASSHRPRWRTAAMAVAGLAWLAFFAFYWQAKQDETGVRPVTEAAVPTTTEAPPTEATAAAAAPVPAVQEPQASGAAPALPPVRIRPSEQAAVVPDAGKTVASSPLPETSEPVPAVADAAADAPGESAGNSAPGDAGAEPVEDATGTPAPSELYRWIDRDGVVRFGERPPDEYAGSAVKVVDF